MGYWGWFDGVGNSCEARGGRQPNTGSCHSRNGLGASPLFSSLQPITPSRSFPLLSLFFSLPYHDPQCRGYFPLPVHLHIRPSTLQDTCNPVQSLPPQTFSPHPQPQPEQGCRPPSLEAQTPSSTSPGRIPSYVSSPVTRPLPRHLLHDLIHLPPFSFPTDATTSLNIPLFPELVPIFIHRYQWPLNF